MKLSDNKEEVCEFEYNGIKCPNKTSKKNPFLYDGKYYPVFSITRCKRLCPIHYKTVTGDNIRKFNKGIEITEELTFTKKLSGSETWSFLGLSLKTEKEVNKDGN